MRYSIRDMLNRYKWHPKYNFSLVCVVYIDRPKGFGEVWGDEIENIGHKFIYLRSGAAIPHHRVVELRYGGKSVWRRRQ